MELKKLSFLQHARFMEILKEFLFLKTKRKIQGTGEGYSVKEIINITRDITHLNINFEISKRRPGDPAILIAKNEKAKKILNWQPKYDLYKIINSAWS